MRDYKSEFIGRIATLNLNGRKTPNISDELEWDVLRQNEGVNLRFTGIVRSIQDANTLKVTIIGVDVENLR